MVFQFLRKLFGGEDGAEDAGEPVEYKGYFITPTPKQVSSGFSTEGVIGKDMDGERRSHRFIRADVHSSKEVAMESSIEKAKRIIDEQGDRMFSS